MTTTHLFLIDFYDVEDKSLDFVDTVEVEDFDEDATFDDEYSAPGYCDQCGTTLRSTMDFYRNEDGSINLSYSSESCLGSYEWSGGIEAFEANKYRMLSEEDAARVEAVIARL